jgi:hypothetical protein
MIKNTFSKLEKLSGIQIIFMMEFFIYKKTMQIED